MSTLLSTVKSVLGSSPRRLLVLDLFLAGVSVACFARVVQVLLAPDPLAPPIARLTERVALRRDEIAPGPPGQTAYDVVATRTLFHPSRTDSNRSGPTQTAPLSAAPELRGVVIGEDTQLAYIEDPATKRIAGYKVGDNVSGGQVERIEKDRVLIRRADGLVQAILSAPNRPRLLASEAPGLRPAGEPAPPQLSPSDLEIRQALGMRPFR